MHDFEKIEQYLADELPERERIAFEEELAGDEMLRKEVELHREIATALQDSETLEFAEKVRTADLEWTQPKAKKRDFSVVFKAPIAIAATFALLLAAYLFFQKPNNPEALAATHFEPYNMVLNYRSDNTDQQLSRAISLYSEGDFEEAATLFSLLSKDFPENTAYPFYEAQSFLAADMEMQKVIHILSEIESTDGHVFQQQARWYLALAYLKKDDVKAAEKMLQDIQQGDYQYLEAKKLLDEL